MFITRVPSIFPSLLLGCSSPCTTVCPLKRVCWLCVYMFRFVFPVSGARAGICTGLFSFVLCTEPRQTQIDAQQRQKDKQKEQDKEEEPPEHREVAEEPPEHREVAEEPLEPEGC